MENSGERYSRQALFSHIGEAGQERLRSARVLVIGCGGLGAVSCELLARAGVGFLRIVDRDVVEISNLQRQSLFDEDDVRERAPKAVAAARHIAAINSEVNVESLVVDMGPGNIAGLLNGIDVVVDGLDNFEGRYLINDACVKHGVPWAYGGCVGSYGVTAFIAPGKTPCLRCLFSEPPQMGAAPTCDTAGVLSTVLHVVSSIQVTNVFQWIVTGEAPARNPLISVDVWDACYDRLFVDYKPEAVNCPCCFRREFEFLDSHGAQTTLLCGRNSVQVCPAGECAPDFSEIAARLSSIGTASAGEYVLFFDMPPYEMTLFCDGRAIVKGTTDAMLARSLVSRYFGV